MQTVQYVGVDYTKVSTIPEFELGTVVTVPVSLSDLTAGGAAQTTTGFSTIKYIKAGAALTAFEVQIIDRANIAGELAAADKAVNHTNLDGKMVSLGVPLVGIASGSYGWVVISELVKVKVLADCAAFVPVYTSGTDGAVDDTSTSQTLIKGLYLLSAASAAAQSKVGNIVGELHAAIM